jgi:hypothetical protein
MALVEQVMIPPGRILTREGKSVFAYEAGCERVCSQLCKNEERKSTVFYPAQPSPNQSIRGIVLAQNMIRMKLRPMQFFGDATPVYGEKGNVLGDGECSWLERRMRSHHSFFADARQAGDVDSHPGQACSRHVTIELELRVTRRRVLLVLWTVSRGPM